MQSRKYIEIHLTKLYHLWLFCIIMTAMSALVNKDHKQTTNLLGKKKLKPNRAKTFNLRIIRAEPESPISKKL